MRLVLLILTLSSIFSTLAPAAWAPPVAPVLTLHFSNGNSQSLPLDGLRSADIATIYNPPYGWYTLLVFHGDLDTYSLTNQSITAHVAGLGPYAGD